ncbi:MAG: 50S ribosomal protein L9 [Erysipelotrichaceae bacterium]|nr:50S ribosomal protein L9 [Erysipelotrichaceae bacterium]
MKVILLQDVKKVGKKGETIEVTDGYATNFLLPRRLAVNATKRSVEILDKQKEDARILDEQNRKNAEELKEKLKTITLEFTCKTGKDGKLFGSVSSKQVVEMLKSKYGISIDKRKFVDKETVNTLGVTILKNELYKGVVAEIKVHVSEAK